MISRSPEARAMAERFHDAYEKLHHKGETRTWDEMVPSYQQRLATTFDVLFRVGAIQPGPLLSDRDAEQPTLQ